MYKKLKGGSCRKNYLACTTQMMLFRGKVTTQADTITQVDTTAQAGAAQTPAQAQTSTISVSGILKLAAILFSQLMHYLAI